MFCFQVYAPSNSELKDRVIDWANDRQNPEGYLFQYISEWDTSRATDMGGVFKGQPSFNADISRWDTSNVTDMSSTFQHALAFNQDISSWDTRRVTTMASMFHSAFSFNYDIGRWNTSSNGNIERLFFGALVFNHDLGAWDTSQVSRMAQAFQFARSFRQAKIGNWDTREVKKNMNKLLDCSALLSDSCARDLLTWRWGDVDSGSVAFKVEYFPMYEDWRTAECSPCPVGSWCIGQGNNTQRYSCKAAHWCPENTTSEAGQHPCPSGKYGSEDVGQRYEAEACTLCEAGRYGRGEAKVGMEAGCAPCPAARTSGLGAPECYLKCSVLGQFWSDGECIKCPPGTSLAELGAADPAACKKCKVGYVAKTSGEANCQPCEAGAYPNDNSTDCVRCPPGSISALGSEACLECPLGKYESRNTECAPCQAGTYPNTDRTQCFRCPGGFISAIGDTTCTKCPLGTWEKGNSACKQCEKGNFPNLDRTFCVRCPAGYVSRSGDTNCTVCPAGTWEKKNTECDPCGPGTYGDLPGLANNTCSGLCLPGTYSGKSALECKRCSVGRFSPRFGQETCDYCGENMVESTDASFCVAAKGFVEGEALGVAFLGKIHDCPFGAICTGGARIESLELTPRFLAPDGPKPGRAPMQRQP